MKWANEWAFNLESFLFVLLEPFSVVQTNTIVALIFGQWLDGIIFYKTVYQILILCHHKYIFFRMQGQTYKTIQISFGIGMPLFQMEMCLWC